MVKDFGVLTKKIYFQPALEKAKYKARSFGT